MGCGSVKIRFNGVLEKGSGGGCPVCGGRRKTEEGLRTVKSYILPSGVTKTFRVGRTEEVSDRDADFLLSYHYLDKQGNDRPVFEVVQ